MDKTLPFIVISKFMRKIKFMPILLYLVHVALFAQSNNIVLSTIPEYVYKINNGPNNESNMESWFYRVSVISEKEIIIKTDSVSLKYFHNNRLIKDTRKYDVSNDMKSKKPLDGLSDVKENFGFYFQFVELVSDSINRMEVTLYCTNINNNTINKTLNIPINYFKQKNRYILPIKGKIFVSCTFITKGDHPEWSQSYAYDFTGIGDKFNLLRDTLYNNSSFEGWGREIIAPANGIVVYSRNDIPDNSYPDRMTLKELFSYPDSIYAVGGNCVVIDHGNNEFSLIAHMQFGSVKVKIGDSVKQGELLGLLGNSGNSSGPHLHYHLMSGKKPFQCDGLPVYFDNSDEKWLSVGFYEIE
jgi:hypothetical protein